jgi:hypothetical protein
MMMNSENGEHMTASNDTHAHWLVVIVIFLAVFGTTTMVNATPVTHTTYDSDRDFFKTTGHVVVNVKIDLLSQIAGGFGAYRDWAMYEINQAKNGQDYSIIFQDVKYRAGGRGGLGIFRIYFDLDWPWPFGTKNKELDFAILTATPNEHGGINRLVIDLEKTGALLKTFRLDIAAKAFDQGSRVDFVAKVKFNGLVDTFFSLARFRQNIEYRVVKVILNLQNHAETRSSQKVSTPQ